MLRLVLRKISRNPTLSVFLVAGLVVAAALLSSIPLYTNGVLERYLLKELEESQLVTGSPPGSYYISRAFTHFGSGSGALEAFPEYAERVPARLWSAVPLKPLVQARRVTLGFLDAQPEERREDVLRPRSPNLVGMDDLQAHARILRGRLYGSSTVDGTFEAIATEQALYDLDLRLGEVVLVRDTAERVPDPLRVRIVGTFVPTGSQDPYWYRRWLGDDSGTASRNASPNANSLFIDAELLDRELVREKGFPFVTAEWYAAFDHREIHFSQLARLLAVIRAQSKAMESEGMSFEVPMLPILERYRTRERELRLTLALLESPVLLMVLFYLSMVSRLIVESEQNDIAVLKSRGGSTRQVFAMYGIESLIYGAVALSLGPPLGLAACRILGASGGFLELVRRAPLPVGLSSGAYGFAGLGLTLFMAAILVPASRGAATTIVLHKRAQGRQRGELAWRKYFLDVLLLAVAGYGYYDFSARRRILDITGVRGSDLPVSPLFFLVSVLFLLGAGLMFIRLFPLLVKLIFRLGQRFWPPELYASFINVARSISQAQYVILFLVLTVGIGVFSSGTARSLDRASEDRIRYAVGADISLMPFWWGEHSAADIVNPESAMLENAAVPRREPPFEAFSTLPGVEAATKVFRKSPVTARGSEGERIVATLLAIVPREYGAVAWHRSDLLPVELASYLRLLVLRPGSVIVSRSVSEEHGVEVGDRLEVTLGEDSSMVATVGAVVDYWPTFNPEARDDQGERANLIVADYTYVRTRMPLEPYEIWIRRDKAVSSRELYEAIGANGVKLVRFRDAEQEIVASRANPFRQGMNGVLTLGFLVSLAVCLSGFLIYWIVSLRSRLLQFGVLRAMGLSRARLLSLLGWEQLLISGSSVAMGVLLGGATTSIFVPLLQVLTDAAAEVPPMRVGILAKDFRTIALFSAGMIAAALALLGVSVSRIRVHQAIKLGED